MTQIAFSFDTEDYVNPHAADGILNCAEILRKAGIKGCFQVVARLAEALVKWGRTDIMEALKYHEIDLHSLAHSYHPTINEYTDLEDFEEAKARFLHDELRAREIVSDVFGVKTFASACPPGSSVSYVAHYGYAEMGIPLYVGDLLIDPVRGRPIMNCNILSTDYHHFLDKFLLECTKEEIDALLDRIAVEKDMYIFYHHPQKGIVLQHPDILNFNKGNTPESEWKLSDRRPQEETDRFYENLTYLVEQVAKDPRFEIVTFADLAKQQQNQTRTIRKEQIPMLKAQLEEDFFPVTDPDSYCISDILLACRDFLCGAESHTCGTVYGFLETPYAIEEPVTVTAAEIQASASAFADGFLPTFVTVGTHKIGPADWLRAAMEVLCGADTVTITPAPWQIDMDQFPGVRDMNLKGRWIHADTFEDRYLSHRYRLQSWTYHLPKGTQRKIFA